MQYETYNVTCPPSTPVTAPLEVAAVTDTSYQVASVTIVIPNGHAGLTGIALALGHEIVIPRNPGAFQSGDGEVFSHDLTGYPAGSPWTIFLVNLDLQAHVWQTRWALETATAPPPLIAPAPIPVDVLEQAA